MTALLTHNLPLLAGASNGIEKLRELILELAVRGKLVPQESSDEPASELLKRIAEEKARLAAEGKVKKQKSFAFIVEEDMPFELPTRWQWSQLGQISSDVQYGFTASANHRNKEPLLLRITDIQNDVVNWDTVPGCDISPAEIANYELKDGDIVIARTGGTIGKSYLVSGLTRSALFASYLIRIGCLDSIYPAFTKVFLGSKFYWKQLYSNSMGTGQPNVSGSALKGLLVPVPPMAEQHRIVAKVNLLMALCDRLEAQQAGAESAHAQLVQALLDSLTHASDATDFAASWQRLAEHFHTLFNTEPSIDALKQTVQQLAVMGKLVPQNPNDEPAIELVRRIRIEKQRHLEKLKARKQKSLATESLLESPYEIPTGWEWQSIDDVLHVTGGVTLGRKLSGRKLVSVPYLRVANVQRGHLQMDQIKEIEVPKDEIGKYLLRNGDLLITEGGDWDKVGRTAIWRDELPECLHQNHVFRARAVIADWEPRWAEMYLNSTSAREYFAGSSKQTTNLASINMTQLRACAFPLPPLVEQRRIVAKVHQLVTLCDELKTRLIQASQLNELLSSTLVQRSLAGDGQKAPIVSDQKTARTLLAAEVTHRLHAQRTFGQRKLQKVVYLAEHAARLATIRATYLRNVAGPHDRQLMNQVETEMKSHQWYERIERKTLGHAYRPLSQAGQHRQAYNRTWSAEEQANIEQVIELMRDWDTDRCEMTVTLYAAWNDFIIEGRPVTDEVIVDEVMHRWNEAKLRFSRGEWMVVLTEMKQHGLLTPTGFGKRTSGGTLTLPGFE
jgi:type I restriction enzyme S subunit